MAGRLKINQLAGLPTAILAILFACFCPSWPGERSELSVDLSIPDSLRIHSLSFRNTDIQDVIQGLAVQFGLNIVVAPQVSGPISAHLANMELKDALILIVEGNGFQVSESDGIIRVDRRPPRRDSLRPREKFEVEFEEERLSVDFHNVSSERVFRKLAETTGRSILSANGVSKNLNGYFRRLPFRSGLQILAELNGLTLTETNGAFVFSDEGAPKASRVGQGSSGRFRASVDSGLVNLESVDAPIADIVSSICSQSGVGLVIYDEIKGTISAHFKGVPIEEAFRILFRGTTLAFWVHEGIFNVGPQSMKVSAGSKLLRLQFLKAEDALNLLPETLTRGVQIKLVKSQNALMALGAQEAIQGMEEFLRRIDIQVPQILIEALVVEVNLDRVRAYGVDMFLGDAAKVASRNTLYPDINQVLDKEHSQRAVDALPGVRNLVSLPKNFVAQIEALEREKVLNIRSKPQIATLNGAEAKLSVGQIQYFVLKSETDYAQGASAGTQRTENFETIEASVTLTVTPFVTGKEEITCDIIPDFSEPVGAFTPGTPPTISRRVLKSKVRLRDGETIVLGGMIKESLHEESRQVPFLGSIPVLGYMFKSKNTVKTRSQLMIFITPHVYRDKGMNVNPEEHLRNQSGLGR